VKVMLYRCIYFFSRLACYIFCKVWLRMEIRGRENVPSSGSFIFSSNHTSHLDPILCGIACPRVIWYMGKKELFRNRLFGWYLSTLNCIPIDREKGDIRTLKTALELLKTGKPMLLFPEGTRSLDGEIGEAKRGVGFIVEKSAAPVIPCYIQNSWRAMPKHSRMIRPVKIRVIVGRPMTFGNIISSEMSREEKQMKISGAVIDTIKGLKKELEAAT
jgi:1-acyl-sn-glycerol-3-phosphate acyltransferase